MSQDLDTLKHAPAESGVTDLLLKRWSPRAYADKPVASSDLTRIFTAAAWAASSYNEQPWRFIVGKKGDAIYSKIFAALAPMNQSWAVTAPILFLTAAKKTFSQNDQPNGFNLHDTGAASANLALEATALGLHVHGMGGFDKTKARVDLEIPADFEVGAAWALGYLGDPAALPENFQKMELAPRVRKQLHEIVFSTWNTPATL